MVNGKKQVSTIPERRPPPEQRNIKPGAQLGTATALSYPVWRCKVCGYLCARDGPPEICPICRATKERFERFM